MAQRVPGSLPALVAALMSVCRLAEAAMDGLYFPMDAVQMVVPPRLAVPGTQLLVAAALREDGSAPGATVAYRLDDPRPGHFHLEPLTGVLTLAAASRRAEGEDMRWSAMVQASQPQHPAATTAKMSVVVVIKDTDEKDVTSQCFWQRAEYSVFENRPATVLGPLGPGFYSPNHTRLSYSLINGSDYLSVVLDPAGGGWSLASKADLDRDSPRPGPRLWARVRCSSAGGMAAESVLHLDVRDDDDNPPAAQEPGGLDAGLKDGRLVEGEDLNVNVVLVDADTVQVNHFQAQLEGDTGGLLELLPPTEFEDDSGAVPRTALHLKLRAAVNASLPSPSYAVKVKVTDTSMMPRDRAVNHAEVVVRLRREGPREAARGAASGAARGPSVRAPAPAYPARVWLFRGASRFSRVATPRDAGEASFSLASGGGGALGVTARGGILYVDSFEALQMAPPTITVTVMSQQLPGGPGVETQVKVHLLDEAHGPCKLSHGNASDWSREYCSEMRSPRACAKTCGFASVRGQRSADRYHTGCQWRAGRKTPDGSSAGYATCTQHVDTCPDNTCDPLERLHANICPQDCSTSRFFDGHLHLKGQPGYMRGDIVCWCDADASCLCLPQEPGGGGKRRPGGGATTTPTSASTSPSDSAEVHTPGAERIQQAGGEGVLSVCGVDCVVGVTVACLFVVLVVTSTCILWRYRCVNHSRRARKYAGAMTSVSGARSEYLDRGQMPLDSNLQPFDPSLPLSPTDPRTTPDPKWEFPRGRLLIEQTLGEGEFGRVMRARALDIAGYPGYTTVAVKTLKEDASSAELADLLSEYQLLKDVSHPNVIRLLGACTDLGAPVYLIIEFAEHGSLRNYLRRSRHVESEGKIPNSFGCGEGNASPNHVKMTTTPRDILSFAWQISKGMAYLSEIKLVHRDLAARNVLVAAGRICKISDFGLTRDVYEDDAYLKRSKGRVPVKWMAVESLADHVYTSKSDVWSFGVLLWELVTLGASPYPGVAVHNLFHLLRAGYRMERPENCSAQLYRVMRSCWQGEPGSRPSFKELTMLLERMLEDGVEYLDLNPRVVHNRTYFTSLAGHDNLLMEVDEDEDVRYGNLSLLRSESTTPLVPLCSVPEEELARLLAASEAAATAATSAVVPRYQNEAAEPAGYLSPVRRGSPTAAYVSMTGRPSPTPPVTTQTPF